MIYLLKKTSERAILSVPYTDKDKFKTLAGPYSYDPDDKTWSIPLSNLLNLNKHFIISDRSEAYTDMQKAFDVNGNMPLHIQEAYKNYKYKLKPMAHQVQDVESCLSHKQFALLNDMGSGKSKTICDTLQILHNAGELPGQVVIIAPLSLLQNWCSELDKNTNMQYTVVNKVADLVEAKIIIMNYEKLLKADIGKYIYSHSIDCIVLDESSKIKNHKAKRTEIILSLSLKTKYKYILSGTPITQDVTDIYSQFKFLNNNYIPYKSWYSFRNRYCRLGGFQNRQIIGHQNMDELKRIISAHSVQRKKEECFDLPDKVYQQRLIPMTDDMKKQYESMRKDLVLELNDMETITAGIVLTKMLRLQEITSGHYCSSPKLNEIIEIMEQGGKDKSIIIWCRFIKSIEILKKHFDEIGIEAGVFSGDTNPLERDRIVKRFQSGELKIFIGQIATGGFGITLTRADMVIYYENDFSLEKRLQSEDRAHRYGQDKHVLYIDLMIDKTIDTHIVKAILSKQKIAVSIVDSFKGTGLNINKIKGVINDK